MGAMGELSSKDASLPCCDDFIVHFDELTYRYCLQMWVATGSYAEPLQSDEQPESWHAFTPDLHTARLTANRMREMNFDYRMNKLCPAARPALPRSWVVFESPSQTRMAHSAC